MPAAWWTGLLYDSQSLDNVLELLLPLESKIPELLDQAVYGLRHPEMAKNAAKLIKFACEGLARLPGCYFGEGALKSLNVFSERFTLRGRVPSQDLLDVYEQNGRLDRSCFDRVEDSWQSLLS